MFDGDEDDINDLYPSTGIENGWGDEDLKDRQWKVELESPFEGDMYDMDEAMALVLGKKVGVGMVCAYASKQQSPGYCCMDQPWERSGELFGTSYECREGENQCIHKAPGISGFSEESCKVYSGTWCPRPTDCSRLTQCIADEEAWAKDNGRITFGSFMKDAPNVTDTTSVQQCGNVKRYLGYDQMYPDMDEICEDLSYLRYKEEFEELDEILQGHGIITDAPEEAALGTLKPPERHNTNADVYQGFIDKIHLISRDCIMLERDLGIIDAFECPEGMYAFTWSCEALQTAAVVISTYALAFQQQTVEMFEFNYAAKQIADVEMYEMFYNSKAVFGNMGIMNENIMKTHVGLTKILKKVDNLSRRRRRLGDGGAHLEAHLEDDEMQPQVHVPASLAWPEKGGLVMVQGKVFTDGDAAADFLHAALQDPNESLLRVTQTTTSKCLGEFDILPSHTGHGKELFGEAKRFAVKMDRMAPSVSCGFTHDSVTYDGKTLWLEEDATVAFFDSTFFYNIEDDCSSSASVEIFVKSSEFDEERSVVLAETETAKGAAQATLFAASNICRSQHRDPSKFCFAMDSMEERVYEIVVKATDAAGLVGTDTCRIIVTPSDGEALDEDHAAVLVARAANAKKYAVGSLSLKWTNA
ncbi:expressed unknown protein [Seminavis robusta]|uniref:Uncharacterized protein n=1 Tax=Seminavis robusta TaxID=568900 RepID=A0A9N8DSW9_9STRA|nr:expressed unknown protein [Seminavis robusta]|eukprot:Sro327_g118330.1 n/a (642) ;mRNA; r:25051-27791